MVLNRAGANKVEVWPLALAEPLPILPVPLRPPDKDALIDLSAALTAIYDEAFYHLSLDYQQDRPPPPFTSEELAWIKQLVQDRV
jgi:hypothetical protein